MGRHLGKIQHRRGLSPARHAWHASSRISYRERIMGYVFIGLIILVLVWLIAVYNGLVGLRQRANQAFADIDVQLKQRHDLIPNLVETVKGYATHEKDTLDAVIKARGAAISAGTPTAQAQAEQQLSGALGRLLALSEAYPDLKANTNFLQLQSQLEGIEDKLSAARRFFNNAVSEYNAATESFPGFLLAQRFGFAPKTFFDIGDSARQTLDAAPPAVKF
jgi:LemA protein